MFAGIVIGRGVDGTEGEVGTRTKNGRALLCSFVRPLRLRLARHVDPTSAPLWIQRELEFRGATQQLDSTSEPSPSTNQPTQQWTTLRLSSTRHCCPTTAAKLFASRGRSQRLVDASATPSILAHSHLPIPSPARSAIWPHPPHPNVRPGISRSRPPTGHGAR